MKGRKNEKGNKNKRVKDDCLIDCFVLWHINPFSGYLMPISADLVVLYLHHVHK